MEELIRNYAKAKEKYMAAIDDLNTSLTALESAAAAIVTFAKAGDQSPAIEAAKARVDVVTSSLTAAVTPPPTV